jgi:hypothetical protein
MNGILTRQITSRLRIRKNVCRPINWHTAVNLLWMPDSWAARRSPRRQPPPSYLVVSHLGSPQTYLGLPGTSTMVGRCIYRSRVVRYSNESVTHNRCGVSPQRVTGQPSGRLAGKAGSSAR